MQTTLTKCDVADVIADGGVGLGELERGFLVGEEDLGSLLVPTPALRELLQREESKERRI